MSRYSTTIRLMDGTGEEVATTTVHHQSELPGPSDISQEITEMVNNHLEKLIEQQKINYSEDLFTIQTSWKDHFSF